MSEPGGWTTPAGWGPPASSGPPAGSPPPGSPPPPPPPSYGGPPYGGPAWGGAPYGRPEVKPGVVPLRPLGELVRPSLEIDKPPKVGGYKWALIAAGIFWVGIMALLVFGFRKKSEEQIAQRTRPATLADQLRPLVQQAQAGELSEAGQAKLELTLLGIWRKRLKLNDADPAEAIIKLRKHEEAGALLRELEKWLHRPGSADEVDLTTLLKPYEQLPVEENLQN